MTTTELPKAQSTRFPWDFFRNWVLASTAGWGMSYFALWIVIMIAANFVRGLGDSFLFLASLPTIVTVVGLLQWLVMRRQVSGGGRWAFAAISGSVCWVLAFEYWRIAVPHAAHQSSVPRLGMTLLYVAGPGAAIGALQWLCVLRQQVPRAHWWIAGSSLGWAVAPLEWIWNFDYGPGIVPVVIRRALLGAVFGAVTGVCLIRLLRQAGRPVQSSVETAQHPSHS